MSLWHRQVNTKEWPAPIWKLISSAEGSWSRCWVTFCCWCEWEPSFPPIWKSLAACQSLLLQRIASSACFFFFFLCFLVTRCYLNSSLRLSFFCSHFHVSFGKENILRSRLSCEDRRCGLHGLSCKYRPRLCPAVLVTSCSRGCAVGSHPAAGQLCHKPVWQQSEFLPHRQHAPS